MTITERVIAYFTSAKREAELPRNRSEARHYLRGRGPFQHFTVSPNEKRTRKSGRSRAKRNAARERVA